MMLNLTYKLTGTGWSECSISDDENGCVITASYLSDALGDLVTGAYAMLEGFKSIGFSFEEEPGEYRWLIEATDFNLMHLSILQFKDFSYKPNSEGSKIFSTSCRPFVFARAVHNAANEVLTNHGENGYLVKWAEHPFPTQQMQLLTDLLALLHNDG